MHDIATITLTVRVIKKSEIFHPVYVVYKTFRSGKILNDRDAYIHSNDITYMQLLGVITCRIKQTICILCTSYVITYSSKCNE